MLLTEIQKLKSDLNSAMQARERTQTAAEINAVKAIEKSAEKAASASFEAQKLPTKRKQPKQRELQRLLLMHRKQRLPLKKRPQRSVWRSKRRPLSAQSLMRMQEKSPEQMAAEKAAAEKAAAARAAKAAADKAAAEKAAAAERAAAEKARAEKAAAERAAAAAAVPPPVVREKPIQYPRVPD